MGGDWEYKGELDEKFQACGHGVATYYGKTYRGTCYGNTFEGTGKLSEILPLSKFYFLCQTISLRNFLSLVIYFQNG